MACFASYPRTMTKDASIQRKELLSPSLSPSFSSLPLFLPPAEIQLTWFPPAHDVLVNKPLLTVLHVHMCGLPGGIQKTKGPGRKCGAEVSARPSKPSSSPSSDLMPLTPRPDSSSVK